MYHNTYLSPSIFSEINHELHLPLTDIVGVTNFLSKTCLSAKQKEYITMLLKAAHQLERVKQRITTIVEKNNNILKFTVRPQLKQLKILLVENNRTAAQVHQQIISNSIAGFLDAVETGEEALAKTSTNQYDLIFMDIGLIDIDGIEVTEQIRAADLKKSQQPIIVGLTAFDLEDVQQECLMAGMNTVIQKPIRPAVLENLVITYF